MFNKNKEVKPTVKTNEPNRTGGGHNSLVKGTYIEGKIKSDSDIRIDGTVKGDIQCKAKVVIGSSGVVEGEVKCQNAVIIGKLSGNIEVQDTLKLDQTAKVNGEISTKKLIVVAGAEFHGYCKMGVDKKSKSIPIQNKSKSNPIVQKEVS